MVLVSFGACPATSAFDVFWLAWPEHARIAKGAARREWDKLRPTPKQAEEWTLAVLNQRESRKWKEGFIPSPKNWLRDERWDDPVETKRPDPGFQLCPHTPRCHNTTWCQVVSARERGEV